MVTNIFKLVFLLILICNFSGCKVTKPILHSNQFGSSDYIFEGEVVKAQKSNLSVVPDANDTYIVKVNKIILASNGHESFEGEDITVVAANDKIANLKERAGYTFFTHTWLFGSTLAVRANYVEASSNKSEELKKELLVYQEREKNSNLQKQLKKAELVVLGHIVETREADLQYTPRISEHNPGWRLAIIEADNILKGNAEDKLQVYFASSPDVNWVDAPTLKEGQKAIYLLKKVDDFKGIKNAFLLIDPQDLLPESRLKDVKKQLKK